MSDLAGRAQVQKLKIDDFSRNLMKLTADELLGEKKDALSFLQNPALLTPLLLLLLPSEEKESPSPFVVSWALFSRRESKDIHQTFLILFSFCCSSLFKFTTIDK